MGLLQNKDTLEKLQQYLTNTNFGNQMLGHNLTMSFLPQNLHSKLEDRRYSFEFKHRIVTKTFSKVTYSQILVDLAIELNNEIKNIQDDTRQILITTGLIEDNRCTKELIKTVIACGIAMKPVMHEGNTSTNMKFSDNLQNVFPEFNESTIDYFLNELDNYKPQI